MNKIRGIVFIFGVSVASSFGYTAYGPFAKGETPQKVAIRTCVELEKKTHEQTGNATDVWRYAKSETSIAPFVKLRRIKNNAGDTCEITVNDKDEKPLCALATDDMPGDYFTVFTADLNQDGEPDFMVNIQCMGCGLAADGSTTTFLLSEKGKYTATQFYSYGFRPEDIVRLKPNGPCYFIHNDLIGNGAEKTKDGRKHNFWVYQLYRFNGKKMVEANKDDARFPKWVWYTDKENHQETDQLTADQKTRLLRKKDK